MLIQEKIRLFLNVTKTLKNRKKQPLEPLDQSVVPRCRYCGYQLNSDGSCTGCFIDTL